MHAAISVGMGGRITEGVAVAVDVAAFLAWDKAALVVSAKIVSAVAVTFFGSFFGLLTEVLSRDALLLRRMDLHLANGCWCRAN